MGGGVKRVFGWLILLALIAVGLLCPLMFDSTSASAPTDDPVVISDYQADFTVRPAGKQHAVETLRGEFPSGRPGIVR
ncbi:MAG: putative rane protein precursor, partial [Mycobacterium sp.]|nr:putative rane protein precursor [Mycobacterium sp.]